MNDDVLLSSLPGQLWITVAPLSSDDQPQDYIADAWKAQLEESSARIRELEEKLRLAEERLEELEENMEKQVAEEVKARMDGKLQQ